MWDCEERFARSTNRELKQLLTATTYRAPGFDRITVTHPPKLLPNSQIAGRKVNEFLFRRHVRRVAKRLGFQRPLLWINAHAAVHMVGRLGESASIYDITDDWTTLTQSAREVSLIQRQDAAFGDDGGAE